jgi:hypothetical protein
MQQRQECLAKSIFNPFLATLLSNRSASMFAFTFNTRELKTDTASTQLLSRDDL